MPIREDIAAYVADYRGVLGWNSFVEPYTSSTQPHVEIALYLNEVTVPTRPLKLNEISTIRTKDPGTQISTTTNIVTFGAPDLLQSQLNGWTITPIVNGVWSPVDINGTPLNYGQFSYNDIISYYIAGRFNRNSAGMWQRKDPDYYITPRGHYYTSPIIAMWQPQDQTVQKKQAFDMLLYLES